MKLQIQNLEFSYASDSVLDNVTLELAAGEVLGVIGPNGAGKSTLLRCINQLLKPDDGSVFVDGDRIANLSREEIAQEIGYIPQEEQSTFPTTVFDTILQGRKPYVSWRPTEADERIVADVLETLGLEDFAMRSIDELSGGQRQKVIIGRALVQEASLLLFDEPTNSLDIRHQLEVLDVIQQQVNEGTAAVMAIHDLNLAARYSDKIAMVHEGEIVAAGPPSILTPEKINEVYSVKATVTTIENRTIVIPETPEK